MHEYLFKYRLKNLILPVINHFETILQQFAAIAVKTHPVRVRFHLFNQKHFLALIATLKYGTENESSKLIFDQQVVFLKDLVNQSVNECVLAIFDKSLDNAAAIFMLCVVKNVAFNFDDEATIQLIELKILDFDQDFLYDVVTIKVK